MTILVTDWGQMVVTPAELAESGATWWKRGKPKNKEARLLMDFATYYTRDDQ